MEAQRWAVELRHLGKAFGACVANADVSLQVAPGTIHGVIGENGAGKSTAMKMLYGQYAPDSGEIWIDGQKRAWKSPADAIEAGIGMVHQHFMLAGPYTALENVVLGAEPFEGEGGFLPSALRKVDYRGARKKLEELSKKYRLAVDWDAPIETLPVGIQQRVEILKLLYREARILILDEPTAVLTPQETDELFENLRALKAQGKTILIITHKLREVMSLTDRVTVFRAGRVTGEVETRKSSPEELAELMVGRKVVLRVEAPSSVAPGSEGKAVLSVSNLKLSDQLNGITFQVRSGEVVGIAGVEGNGQSELLEAISHPADPSCRESGEVRIFGEDVTRVSSRQIRRLPMGVIPEDRHRQGLLLEKPILENYLLGLQDHPRFVGPLGFIRWGALSEAAAAALEKYDVRPRRLDVAAGGLSGGNQQKVIIGREFEHEPKFLVAAQPTRGVDVGAIEFIHGRILKARDEGAGILLVSSELDEILSLSDRILVLYEGRIVAEFVRGEATERELGMSMSGATR